MFKHVFSTAMSTNYRYRSNRVLMRAMIERLNPRVAAISTTSGGSAQPWRLATTHRLIPYYVWTARRVVTKIPARHGDTHCSSSKRA